jgi:tetratricopeptide (TPR) repeat protein/DNA-binding CsgD family transcriptional regulator
MRDAIAWSYDLLEPNERRVFRALGMFAGGFTLEAAEFVCDRLASGETVPESWREPDHTSMLDQVAELVDQSLLRQRGEEDGDPRFDMFQTIQEFALDELAKRGEFNAVQRARAEYCIDLIDRVSPELTGPNQQKLFECLETEHDNIRAALAFALQEQDAPLAQRLARWLWRFWWVRGHLSEGRRWLDQVLALEGVVSLDRAHCLRGAAALAEDQGDYERCLPLYDEALLAARALDDQQLEAQVLDSLGNVAHDRGTYEEAARRHREALAIFQKLDDRRGIAGSLHNLGTVSYFQGDLDAAEAAYTRSHELLREIGDLRSMGLVLGNLGSVVYARGEFERSIQMHEQSLTAMRTIGDEMGAASAITNLASAFHRLGDLSRAVELNGQALEILERIGVKRLAAHVRGNLGRIAAEEGDHVRSVELLVSALSGSWECKDLVTTNETLESLAQQACVLGDPGLGARLLGAASALRVSVGIGYSESQSSAQQEVLDLVRRAAGGAFEAAWSDGTSAPIEEVVAEALRMNELAAATPSSREDDEIARRTGLTRREIEVLRLIVAGRTHQEIADALEVSLTVATVQVGQLYTKIGADSRAGLTAFAFKHGLV